jgi:hypothetical protein
MGMMLEVLPPGVEYAEEANLRAEVRWGGCNFQECRRAGVEEQTVKEALILVGEGRQLVG